MTVCIAALYGNGSGAVLASDRMVTAHFPIGYEFEYEERSKIVELDNVTEVCALIAGDILSGNEVLDAAKLNMLRQKDGGFTATEVGEIVRASYQNVRLSKIIQREIEPRGLDLNSYYSNHQQLSPNVVQMIDNALSNGDMGVEMLIAGANGESFSIYTIVNPGTISDNSSIGRGAIGSGAPHALYSLIEDGYEPSFGKDKVIELVSKAKKRSEVAPGVGQETTIIAIPLEESNVEK